MLSVPFLDVPPLGIADCDDSESDVESEASSTEGSDPSISDILRKGMVESKFEKTPNSFLPRCILSEVFAKHPDNPKRTVLEAMDIDEEHALTDDYLLADYILEHAKTVFIISVYIRLPSLRLAMSIFKDNNFGDSNLPIERWSGEKFDADSRKHPFAMMERNSMKKLKRKWNRIWDWTNVFEFQGDQWKFLVPVISTTEENHDFVGEHVLPFITRSPVASAGSFGVVCKYEIHSAHFEDPTALEGTIPTHVFAVKEIKEDRARVATHWQAEVKALAKMNTLNQDHIVRFITAFRRGKQDHLDHYVVFEWADGGNLSDLWEANPRPVLRASLVKAVIEQLYGLAEAVCEAHYLKDDDGRYSNTSYRHGDLKPANILWFRKGGEIGTLKIGDWGEAKSHNVVTALRHSTTAQFGTRRYEPPEVETSDARSRLYDIWGFGCITLEFIIWLLYGHLELKRFNESGKEDHSGFSAFYEFDHRSGSSVAKVHRIVSHWMEHMAQEPICRKNTSALGDLLDIVREGLLVVKFPPGGGTFDPRIHTQLFPHRTETYKATDTGRPSLRDEIQLQPAPSDEIPSINVTLPDSAEDFIRPERTLREPGRFRAFELTDRLTHINTADENESYWFSGSPQRPAPMSLPNSSTVSLPIRTPLKKPVAGQLGVRQVEHANYAHPKLDPEDWEFVVDNRFAATVISGVADLTGSPAPTSHASSQLCIKCQGFRNRLWSPFFSIIYDTPMLTASAAAGTCDLCSLLWQTCESNYDTMFPTVQFERHGSALKINGAKLPLLSLLRSNHSKSRATDVQIGLAELSESGQELHFHIIRSWLTDCDTHTKPTCKPTREKIWSAENHMGTRLPTRLIDVGSVDQDTVRLWETKPEDVGGCEWVALSYQWGPLPHFSTTRQSLQQHIMGMKLTALPATFVDAITVTRALGRRYLWIDSLCIIQGQGGDFYEEAERMEDVYSGAYCVLAASCATGQKSGFLGTRKSRKYVALSSEAGIDGTFYVCQMIDNFKDHVLKGALNRRGWVLQEHALARRTVFFTEHQTYFECGQGVRCESMAKMTNESAALLGDPDFPKILNPATQGERIIRFQELYQQYSRLDLTTDYDRPTAIGGLQHRLLKAMVVQGGYGVFEESRSPGLFRRSLLWHRGHDISTLRLIEFPAHRERVPSWSWMAVSGGIDYFPLDFNGFAWESIESPWSRSADTICDNALIAYAQEYDQSAAKPGEDLITFDTATESERVQALAVVLGIQKGDTALEGKRHYVLVVAPKGTSNGIKVCERVGAGYLPGRCLVYNKGLVHIV